MSRSSLELHSRPDIERIKGIGPPLSTTNQYITFTINRATLEKIIK